MQIVAPIFLFPLASKKGLIAFFLFCRRRRLPRGFKAKKIVKKNQGSDATVGDSFAPLGETHGKGTQSASQPAMDRLLDY